jgi:hypothetical protein
MGTRFDETVLVQMKETFEDGRAHDAEDLLSTGDPSIVTNPKGSSDKKNKSE